MFTTNSPSGDTSNIIRVKNLQDLSPSVLAERNSKQLKYASKCFTDFGHSQVLLLSRGAATTRAAHLFLDLKEEFKDEQLKVSQKNVFSFNVPLEYMPVPQVQSLLTTESEMFDGCGTSIQARIERLAGFKEPGTDFRLKPCMSLDL